MSSALTDGAALIAGAGAAIAVAVSRTTGAGWLPAVGLALLLSAGLYLWARDPEKGWGDLGEGIMVSVIVAIALMAVQRDADERTRLATERREELLRRADVRAERRLREAEAASQAAADRQNLQLTLTTQSDLTGIGLAERNLRGFFLARKNLERADLHGADLTRADLRGTALRRANLLGAVLDEARLPAADLSDAILSPDDARAAPASRPARFRRAEMPDAKLRATTVTGVDFTGASLGASDLRKLNHFQGRDSAGAGPILRRAVLIDADFRGAEMPHADLRDALLGGATFCNVGGLRSARMAGALYDASTRWPAGFEPRARGARRVRGDKARTFMHEGVPLTPFPRRFPQCR